MCLAICWQDGGAGLRKAVTRTESCGAGKSWRALKVHYPPGKLWQSGRKLISGNPSHPEAINLVRKEIWARVHTAGYPAGVHMNLGLMTAPDLFRSGHKWENSATCLAYYPQNTSTDHVKNSILSFGLRVISAGIRSSSAHDTHTPKAAH